MEIRSFIKSDAKKVSQLICKTLRNVNSKDYAPEIIEQLCARFAPENMDDISKERSMFVILKDNIIVGTGSLKENVILTLFVDYQQRQTGIGKRIMSHLEKLAITNGYTKTLVPSSITSVGFYKRLGYTEVEIKNSDFGDNIVMEKNLDA